MDHQVIIIGAGMSGLSAAIKLLESNVKNILILEANDRIGGRISTRPFGGNDGFIELGAQWIHGTKGNPIYELAKVLHMLDNHKDDDDERIIYCTQDGSVLNNEYVDKIFNKIENIFDNLDDLIENELEDDSDQNLGALLDDGFIKILNRLKSDQNLDVELIKSIYRARQNEEKFESSCDDLHKLSAVGWNEYEDFDGEQFTKLKHGYTKLIEYFKSQIPEECFKLNSLVEKIDWDTNDKLAKISVLNKSDNSRKTYMAKCVLCTASLGYLKKHHQELFNPKLPSNKVKAIEHLGFGCVNKVFVVYDKPITSFQGLQIFWREDIPFKLEAADKKWNLKEHKFYRCLDNFELLPKMPNVLLGFVVGPDAIYLESLEEECLVDVIHELFSKCFPKLKLPRPKTVIRSKWSSDPYANGSYTYVRVGSSINDVKSLSQPISNQLFFSGEGTTFKYIGTVHGAYISGRDAANKIIKALH